MKNASLTSSFKVIVKVTNLAAQSEPFPFLPGQLFHTHIVLRLAYSWARPAILVAGKGRRGMFLFLLFLLLFLPCLSLSSPLLSLLSLFYLPLRWHKMTHKGGGVIKPRHSQSTISSLPFSEGGGVWVVGWYDGVGYLT